MSENLKDLLEKINQEGIKSAEEKAMIIESKAEKDAEKILEDARKFADNIIQEANSSALRLKATAEASLKQASRDTILSLKEEIRKILNKIVALEISKAMSGEETGKILAGLIEKYVDKNGQVGDVKVLVKEEDLKKIKDGFMSKLKDKVASGVEFKPSANINAGFSISFDKGKSYFDFSDEGLLDALSVYLNPELAKLIK